MSQGKNRNADYTAYRTKQERCVSLAKYIIATGATVRTAAKMFGVGKSTVYHDVTARLEKVNPALHKQTKKVLGINKQERHIRGGMATKRKFEQMR